MFLGPKIDSGSTFSRRIVNGTENWSKTTFYMGKYLLKVKNDATRTKSAGLVELPLLITLGKYLPTDLVRAPWT